MSAVVWIKNVGTIATEDRLLNWRTMIEKTCVLRNQAAETHGHYFLMVLTHETSVAAFLNINHSIRSKAPWSSELNQMIQNPRGNRFGIAAIKFAAAATIYQL